MLVIKPLEDKSVQKDMVQRVGGTYHEPGLAYLANDCEEDGETVRHPIGICQFRLHETGGVIDTLRCVPGVSDTEALLIMARAVMSFLYRCGFKTVTLTADAASEETVRALEFDRDNNGLPKMNLIEFYTSPCRGSHPTV